MNTSHINYVANGMGSQSMYLLYLASQQRIKATVSITADTGWETDCDLMTGEKTTAADFFKKYIQPFGKKHGIPAFFVRTVDRNKKPIPSLQDYLEAKKTVGGIPAFGSNGGRNRQTCTDKWKIRAMRQQLRRLGARTARSAQGILYEERPRRVKGSYVGNLDGFDTYRMELQRHSHYYPLVDMQMTRKDVRAEMDRLGLPYLISSECNGCPHADKWRWLRRSPETIEKTSVLESSWNGEYFLTDKRRPLKDVIAEFKQTDIDQGNLFQDDTGFDCTGGYCGG